MKKNHQAKTCTSRKRIRCGQSSAVLLPEKGATLCSLTLGEPACELLYLHDFFWQDSWHDLAGGWPFLFPVCARLARDGQSGRYQYQGRYYTLPIHGFSWQRPWQVLEHQDDRIVVALSATKETKRCYPFDFHVELDYQIGVNTLRCQQRYQNRGLNAMPFYAGFHPYFALPQHADKDSSWVQFESQKRYVYNENLTDIIDVTTALPERSKLSDHSINETLSRFDPKAGAALIFPHKTLTLTANDAHDHFSYLQLYHQVDKPFFCMEPWMSFPNALNSCDGSVWLAPGETLTSSLLLTVKSS